VSAGSDFTKTCVTNASGAEIGETAEAGNTYSWSPAIGLSSATVSNPTANPSSTTTYTVTKTTTANGCTSTASVTVTVNTTAPSVSAGSDFTKTCTTNPAGAEIGDGGGDTRTALSKWRRCGSNHVEHREFVSGPEDAPCHPLTHATETDEADFHVIVTPFK
jgi:hypothetical protein